MRIVVTSVLVDDQAKAHRFYTDVLGFVTKNDIDLGEARWLTVVSPDDPDGTELLLEPDGHRSAISRSGAVSRSWNLKRPCRRVLTSPASSRTSRCCEIAWRVEPRPWLLISRTQSSYSVWPSRCCSSSRIARRVGSASAL